MLRYYGQQRQQNTSAAAPLLQNRAPPPLNPVSREALADAERRLAAENQDEESKKMNVPCFGRVYKRQMLVNAISFFVLCWAAGMICLVIFK